MKKSTYQQKLLDPRWQKKRLEILSRDEFTCQGCFDSESTLHVHHKVYSNVNPWEYDNNCLITLCADCHTEETNSLSEACSLLEEEVRIKFLSGHIYNIALSLHEAKFKYPEDVMAELIHCLLTNPEVQEAAMGVTNKFKGAKNEVV